MDYKHTLNLPKTDFPMKANLAQSEPRMLAWWDEIATVPSVAIGGITASNCTALVQAGADFLAVIAAVWNDPEGPAAGVRRLNAAIDAAS